MEYTPRHRQPFSLPQAILLDVPIIAEGPCYHQACDAHVWVGGIDASSLYTEISRLQNSLVHLKETQKQLREYILDSPDPDISQAIEENVEVMYELRSLNLCVLLSPLYSASQEERIIMLKLALTHKGVPAGSHLAEPISRDVETSTVPPETVTDTDSSVGGVYL